jgi:Tfp pilus assembly protein PilO
MSSWFAQFLAVLRLRPVVTGSLLIALILGAANYFLWQQRKIVTQEDDKVRRKGQAILDALIGRQHVNADLVKLKDALGVIDRNLVSESDMEVNLGYFYRMEKLSRIRFSQLNQLSALPPVEGNPFKVVPFSLRATGTYIQLLNFVHQLETGSRILTVRAFNFSRGDPKTNLLTLDLTVDLLAAP